MGGAAGHINHPHDRKDLTFFQLKELGVRALEGQLGQEKKVTEKVDGLQLQITFKDGVLKCARNKSHIINPVTIDELMVFFEDRGALTDAFNLAVTDLNTAFTQLPESFLHDFFKNGKRFINLEILYPAVKNVIPYGEQPYLQFHNILEYNDNAEVVATGLNVLTSLISALQKGNLDTQSTFKIIISQPILLEKVANLTQEKEAFITALNKLQKEFNLSDSNTVFDYHERWWEKYIKENFEDLPSQTKPILIKRWGNNDKGNRIYERDFISEEQYNKVRTFDKNEYKKINEQNEEQFELIFLDLGIKVLNTVKNHLSPVSQKDFINQILERVKSIKQEIDNQEELRRVYHELQTIQKLGGLNNAIPLEGIIFFYNKDMYKLTGMFAPLNKLLGFFRYSRVER